MVDVAQRTEHPAKYAVLSSLLSHAVCQLKTPTRAKVEGRNLWKDSDWGIKEWPKKKSQLSDLCSVANIDTPMVNIKWAGWCPNVTQKRKKELQLSSTVVQQVQQPVDLISQQQSQQTIIKKKCKIKKHTVLWIQFNLSIVWCPEDIITFIENCKLICNKLNCKLLIFRYWF